VGDSLRRPPDALLYFNALPGNSRRFAVFQIANCMKNK
jgi:hypothetical protein